MVGAGCGREKVGAREERNIYSMLVGSCVCTNKPKFTTVTYSPIGNNTRKITLIFIAII